jgi:hypothetical protein
MHGSFGGAGFPAGVAAFGEYTIDYPRRMYAVPEGCRSSRRPRCLQTMHDAISTNGALAAGQSVPGDADRRSDGQCGAHGRRAGEFDFDLHSLRRTTYVGSRSNA